MARLRGDRRSGDGVGRIGCVAVVKNEERHIAEWLAWQFHVGFDTVVLLDNGSTDGTAAIARGFARNRDVRVLNYPNAAPDYQLRGYEATARALAAEFEWLAFFDTDEFLRLDEGVSLKTLLSSRPEAAVAVSWAMFGSSGHDEMPEGLVIECFTRRSRPDFPPNRHVKSIIRPGLMGRALSAHAFAMAGDTVDLAGRPVRWEGADGYLPQDPDYAGGALNHYFTRSRAHWRAKLARGYPDTVRRDGDFEIYDRNEVEDDRLVRHVPAIREMLAGATPKYRHVIVACARWETRYITEWLNYYRVLGFDHVYLYCNDDDPTALYAEILPFTQGPAPFVTFRHHARQGEQFEMYAHFLRHGLEDADWVSFFDIDEFLRLPPGGTIGDFMSRFGPEVDAVLFNWLPFGPDGHKEPPEGYVLENFTAREENIHPYTKFAARARALAALDLSDRARAHGFWHHLDRKLNVPHRSVNVLGEEMASYYLVFPDGAARFVNAPERKERLLNTAIIHHYGLRSERAFWDRAARGLGGDFKDQTIWREHAEGPNFQGLLAHFNKVRDETLAGFWKERLEAAWEAGTGEPPISRRKQVVHGVARDGRSLSQVDLGAIATIREIHLHGGAGDFTLSVSIDGEAWVELAAGPDGALYVWNGPGTAWARYVRVMGGGTAPGIGVFGERP